MSRNHSGIKWIAVTLSWIALLSYGMLIFLKQPTEPLFFSLSIPIVLVLFAAHEWKGVKLGLLWGSIALGISMAFSFFSWNRLTAYEFTFVVIHLFLALYALTIASRYLSRIDLHISALKHNISEIQTKLKSKSNENTFYSERIRQLQSQISERKRLSSYARIMGTLLEPDIIKQTLIDQTKELFPEEDVRLQTVTATDDPVDSWVWEQKNSLLVKDYSNDKRLNIQDSRQMTAGIPQIKSLVATPLMIERAMMGLIRADSKKPNRFTGSDIQNLEVYAHLATLALGNAHLFSKVNAMATKDGLTGLATHRIFQEKLEQELLRAARYHAHVSLIMLDIDHFKKVNDTYGHLIGDNVLKGIAQILLNHCRTVDFPARYGGEEFCLILPELDLNQTHRLAENLRSQIEFYEFSTPQENFRASASFGCASFPQDAQTSSQIIRKADERLYKAKSSGRNQVVIS